MVNGENVEVTFCLELDPTMHNMTLVRAILLYYNMFKLQASMYTNRKTDRET